LACYQAATPQSPLTYWHREARSSNAEVDYLMQSGQEIIPIEVKAGVKGGMKSMHRFLKEKDATRGVRISKDTSSDTGTICSIPFYEIERLFLDVPA
jgi:uncharacterized protein